MADADLDLAVEGAIYGRLWCHGNVARIVALIVPEVTTVCDSGENTKAFALERRRSEDGRWSSYQRRCRREDHELHPHRR